MSSPPGSGRQRSLLRDLDRLDRRRLMSAASTTTTTTTATPATPVPVPVPVPVPAPAQPVPASPPQPRPSSERTGDDDNNRRQRLQRVLARLSRLQESRTLHEPAPSFDWTPPPSDGHEDDQARRRPPHRRHDSLRSVAIMHNARTSVRSPTGTLRSRDRLSPEPDDHTRAYRRGYLADNPSLHPWSSPASVSPALESTVQYLDHVRACSSRDEAVYAAMEHGLSPPDDYEDFLTDPRACPRPQPSSWLVPGASFQGSQHTTSNKDSQYSNLRSSAPFDATRPWLSHTPAPPVPNILATPTTSRDIQDRWPVRVTVQTVDYGRMTMAGTMEAYDVPNTACAPPSPTAPCRQTAPITTYLEGQIVDFGLHSLLTPPGPAHGRGMSFPPTSAATDAANWRNLPPFSALASDEDVARALVSRAHMSRILSEWVLMRWKERCFIHSPSDPCHSNGHVNPGQGDDTDTGHGLTISGFYYVSLRRSDGRIDGLYFDTKTSPYQHLRLEARNGGSVGTWAFK